MLEAADTAPMFGIVAIPGALRLDCKQCHNTVTGSGWLLGLLLAVSLAAVACRGGRWNHAGAHQHTRRRRNRAAGCTRVELTDLSVSGSASSKFKPGRVRHSCSTTCRPAADSGGSTSEVRCVRASSVSRPAAVSSNRDQRLPNLKLCRLVTAASWGGTDAKPSVVRCSNTVGQAGVEGEPCAGRNQQHRQGGLQ